MSAARVFGTALAACVPVLLVGMPSHASPERAVQRTVTSAATSPETGTARGAGARTARSVHPRKQNSLDAALQRHVDHREQALTALLAAAEQHAQVEGVRIERLAALGYSEDVEDLDHVLPVPASSYRLSAGFGAHGALWSRDHTGLDFAAPSGTSLVAVADATVTEVSLAGSYGLRTILTLEDGTEVWYAHQLVSLVTPGETVEIGQPIGMVGSTGNSTGPHLHLEVHPDGGEAVDPAAWLVDQALTP